MFGEKPMYGQNELKLCDKGRIFIPASTKREPGEELILLYNSFSKVHEIYSSKILEEKFEKLNQLLMNAQNEQDKKYYEISLLQLSKSILKSEKVDAQGRFLTGKVFEGEEKLLCTGAYDHLIIEPIKIKK